MGMQAVELVLDHGEAGLDAGGFYFSGFGQGNERGVPSLKSFKRPARPFRAEAACGRRAAISAIVAESPEVARSRPVGMLTADPLRKSGRSASWLSTNRGVRPGWVDSCPAAFGCRVEKADACFGDIERWLATSRKPLPSL
jgi:hypothetical protein